MPVPAAIGSGTMRAKPITQLGYGQRISWSGVLDAGAMLQFEKHPYDGKRERNIGVTFDLNYRF